jgi:hypothetical protein
VLKWMTPHWGSNADPSNRLPWITGCGSFVPGVCAESSCG